MVDDSKQGGRRLPRVFEMQKSQVVIAKDMVEVREGFLQQERQGKRAR